MDGMPTSPKCRSCKPFVCQEESAGPFSVAGVTSTYVTPLLRRSLALVTVVTRWVGYPALTHTEHGNSPLDLPDSRLGKLPPPYNARWRQ